MVAGPRRCRRSRPTGIHVLPDPVDVPVLSEGYESESYSSGFVMVFGWGMLLVVALCSAVMSLIPWKTPVDEFEPLRLEAASEED